VDLSFFQINHEKIMDLRVRDWHTLRICDRGINPRIFGFADFKNNACILINFQHFASLLAQPSKSNIYAFRAQLKHKLRGKIERSTARLGT
jgi:hypothetical protein